MRKLFEPPVDTYLVDHPTPTADRAPDHLAAGTPPRLRADLEELLGDPSVVLGRGFDLVRFATDASPYRMFPQVVVLARDVSDVQKVLAYGHAHAIPVTFRAAGTSLSGQSQGDGILVEVMRNWIGCTVEDGGRTLRSKPGTILARANAALKRHGYRLGPDPGVEGGVHDRRRRGQQRQRDVLRDGRELLPDTAVDDDRAAVGDRHRHRRHRTPRSAWPRPSRRSPPGWARSGTRSWPTR